MSRKRKHKRQPIRRPPVAEDSRAEVVTVAWMLAAITTLGAEVVGGLLLAVTGFVADAPASLVSLSNVMLFTAAVTGIVCLSLTPLVYGFRRTPPPTGVTVMAVGVSVLPFAVGMVLLLR